MNNCTVNNERSKIFNEIPNDILFKYVENCVNLEVAKATAFMNLNNLQQKRADLITEKKKLNEIHQRLFSMNNEICDSVWKFTNEYNVPSVINDYLNGRKTIRKVPPSFSHDKFEQLENILQTLSNETADIAKDLKKLYDKDNLKNFKEEISIDGFSTMKFGTLMMEAPKKTNDISSSTFKVKTQSAILKMCNKR